MGIINQPAMAVWSELPVSKQGGQGLSYWLAQIWSNREKVRVGFKAVSNQTSKWSQTLFLTLN